MPTTTRRYFIWQRLAAVLALLGFVLLLAGCNGGGDDDDDDGPGNGGDPVSGVVIEGPEGTSIPVPDDPANLVATNAVIDLNSTVEYDAATGEVSLHFFYKDTDGNGISLTQNPVELRYYVSELIAEPGPNNPGLTWNQRLAGRGTPSDPEATNDGLLTVINGETGEYRYTFAETLPATTNVIRVTVRARARVNIDGTNYYLVQNANASYDFLQANAGSPLAASGADMVDTATCNSCHGVRIGGVGHGGGYTETKTCTQCHNLPYQEPRNSGQGDLSFMVHRIHNAGTFGLLEGGVDFSHVTYPQEITTCTKCHSDTAPNAELAFTNPTRRNCGSCHASVNFATGENHDGGVFTDDSLCSACHQKNGSSIDGGIPGNDHKSMIAGSALEADPKDVPEFNVDISMTAPANGDYYEAGETPVVTVSLTPIGGGPAANYTAAQDANGNRDGALSSANLYVYGPRNDAVPVLTIGSTTDPAWDPATNPRQGHPLFVGSDAQVRTDSDSYKYELLPIPDDLEPGTYMARFEGGDYGAFSDEDYQTSSTRVINFQVGTAEEEHRLSGDACVNCHGDTRMHVAGAHPHNEGFDTDGCLACHDGTGNYGNYIGNRVHAVHGETLTGDLGPHAGDADWTHVTFPQDVNNCTICHTDPAVEQPVWRTIRPVACAGCHGSDPESSHVFDDGRGSEATAASHMMLQGADFSDQQQETPGCLVCHGEGQEQDLFKTHGLINFIVPDVPDPEE